MRVYYAHAMVLYGTEIEQAEVGIIRNGLEGCEIVDPGEYEGNPEKSEQAMKLCFKLIDRCDALAFSRLLGKITSGVGAEINYALSTHKPVYLVGNGRLTRITRRVSYLSREDTWKHYDFWRLVTGRSRSHADTV